MDDKYLNQTMNYKYLDDFNNKILKVNKEIWILPDKIRYYQIRINENPKMKALYSKYPEAKHDNNHNESYLTIAYCQDIELKILIFVLPMLVEKYNLIKNCTFNYLFHEPRNNPNFDGEKSQIDIACLNDNNYNMVNNIRPVLKCISREYTG